MGGDLGELLAADAVLQRPAHVALQLRVAAEGDQGGDGDQAALARRELGSLPHIGKQDVVGEVGELRSVLPDEVGGDAGVGAGHGGLLLVGTARVSLQR